MALLSGVSVKTAVVMQELLDIVQALAKKITHWKTLKVVKIKLRKHGIGELTMNELKPCPFCGGKDSGILTTSYDGYWFAVFCEDCMAQTRKCRQEKDAIEAWNRRVDNDLALSNA